MKNILFAAAVLAALVSTEASASMVVGQWYHGRWSCKIDGRPSTMEWKVVSDTQQSCQGGVCSQTAGAKTVGRFKERTGPWVPLHLVNANATTLSMRYNNVDPWALKRNGSGFGSASGHTTWQGRRYPLECTKI